MPSCTSSFLLNFRNMDAMTGSSHLSTINHDGKTKRIVVKLLLTARAAGNTISGLIVKHYIFTFPVLITLFL